MLHLRTKRFWTESTQNKDAQGGDLCRTCIVYNYTKYLSLTWENAVDFRKQNVIHSDFKHAGTPGPSMGVIFKK